MAVSTIKRTSTGFEERQVDWSVTVPANGNNNTNLKTLIDADLPSGKRFLAITGFSTNDVSVVMIACRYANSSYSLQVVNISASSRTTTVGVRYLCGY